MIDFSPSSIRIALVMILGVIWFGLIIDNIMNSGEEG
tara:strand:- start:329 stop:439 length:111 start_codon:yes stop_codon:yes gene_type:complete